MRGHYLHDRNIKFTILFLFCGGRRCFFRHIAGGHTLIKINPGNLSFTVANGESFVLPITNP
ncbi:hypothetical protein DMR35_13235 [Klebsiella variicola]|nr:hypothetical protein [Klebsiella variicola]PXJ98622.1 hypothetical protein DMR35_13235 [Klebsiella variicola]PXK85961.1 hypothetical protein DMS07_03790 [Klebsiella variicola]HBX2063149.1 hypothetical protein [Klebsiella variicola]